MRAPSSPADRGSRLRRLRRRALAALLWALFCYAAAGALPMLLQHRWEKIGPATERIKWPALRRLVARHPDRPLLLMLGSSRACWDFRAAALDGMPDSDGRPLSVYNFGIPATGPVAELFCLQDLLAEGIRPRFLLIEVLPPLLCKPRRGAFTEEGMLGFDSLSARQFLRWLPYLHRPGECAQRWLRPRLAPWHTFREYLELEVKCLAEGRPLPTFQPVDDWGWHVAYPLPFPPWERLRRLGLSRDGHFPALSHFRLGKKQAQALRELLDLCRREEVPAALVLMPESSEMRGWYSDEAKAAVRGLLDELSRDYGVEVLDANCWLADYDFEDGQHAVLHGADVFTCRLAWELPRLLARSKPVGAPPSSPPPPLGVDPFAALSTLRRRILGPPS